jgi:ER membrane protein complex subunit 8/9
MSSSATVVASPEAYTKALLHCYKYPTQPVMGMLVGKRLSEDSGVAAAGGAGQSSNNSGNGGGAGSSSNSGSSGSCFVSDAVPLFHTLPMTAPNPMLEVAFAHVQYAARTTGQSLLGVYIANERLMDNKVSPITKRMLDALQSRMPSQTKLLVWFISNECLTSPPVGLAITSLTADRCSPEKAIPLPSQASIEESMTFGRWNSDTLAPGATVTEEGVMETVSNALDAFAHYRIADLDDHVEDPSINYLEQPLSALMMRK